MQYNTNSSALATLINKFKFESIAEIGVSRGLTSEFIMKNCTSVKKYYMIDITDIAFDKTILKYPQAEYIMLPSNEAVNKFENHSLDLVYIDANHGYSEVVEDIAIWMPKVKKGGILSGHDYIDTQSKVIPAVHKFFEKVELLEEKNGNKSWWIQL